MSKITLDELIEETQRCNFHHVNDTGQPKHFSYGLCAEIAKHLMELRRLQRRIVEYGAEIRAWSGSLDKERAENARLRAALEGIASAPHWHLCDSDNSDTSFKLECCNCHVADALTALEKNDLP